MDLDYGATNDVSVDGNLVFVANGGYGVALVRASKSLRPPSSEPAALELVGTLELGASANHVAYRRGLLFVAAGSGGLKILRVDDDA